MKKCCIIFLTAFDEFAYAKKAITVRALDYLLKPWDEKELMLVLEEAMRMAGEEKIFRKKRQKRYPRKKNGTIRKNWQKMMQVKICA